MSEKTIPAKQRQGKIKELEVKEGRVSFVFERALNDAQATVFWVEEGSELDAVIEGWLWSRTEFLVIQYEFSPDGKVHVLKADLPDRLSEYKKSLGLF